jgi:clan AA aspartic protease
MEEVSCEERHMGFTHVTTQISNLAQDAAPWEAEFLVDTGAIDCMAPRDRLIEAGIRPEGKSVYELANGQPVEYEYGFVRVAFLGAETVAQIIFGPPDTEPILGVVALENTGLMVDPITRTLRRMHARPLKSFFDPGIREDHSPGSPI